jgi:hypothetical protein
MAVFAVYIEKQSQYFGELAVFGNTYHYSTDPGQVFLDQAVAEDVAAAEAVVTQSSVDFIRWQTWGPTDGAPLANVMREAGELAFSGGGSAVAGTYKEACALVVLEIARSPLLNRRRWLRKFVRVPGGATMGLTGDTLAGSAPLSPELQALLVAYGNEIKTMPNVADSYTLCTEAGDGVPVATNAQVRPYLFTRQIGQ